MEVKSPLIFTGERAFFVETLIVEALFYNLMNRFLSTNDASASCHLK